MNAEHHTGAHGAHDDGQHGHDGHGHEVVPFHGTLRDYVNGFVLSVVLTAIPFWLVMSGGVGSSLTTGLIVLGFAAVQIVVHMVYFLHMNAKAEGGWSMLALIFTAVIVLIVLAGSLWVMYHLNANMMPMTPHEARQAP